MTKRDKIVQPQSSARPLFYPRDHAFRSANKGRASVINNSIRTDDRLFRFTSFYRSKNQNNRIITYTEILMPDPIAARTTHFFCCWSHSNLLLLPALQYGELKDPELAVSATTSVAASLTWRRRRA